MASPVEVSPSDLRFRFQVNKQLLASITINNPGSQRVAFKIKTTAPKKYVVRPSSGVVEPRSYVSVQVIMQAQKEYAPEFVNCKDKFMVQTTELSELEEIEKDTFLKDVRQDLKEYRLRVTIEGPAAPPSPVPEANEADDDSTAAVRAAGVNAVAPVPQLEPPQPSSVEPSIDPRLRNALDNLSAATVDNQQLKAQLDRLQRERDELRRKLDVFQLQGGDFKVNSGATQHAVMPKPQMPTVMILLAAIIAFLVGHFLRF